MSEASSGEIQACARQVKIEENEEASSSDGQLCMEQVEVKDEVITSTDWQYYMQNVVIQDSAETSASNCQDCESNVKSEDALEASFNDWRYYMQQIVIEQSEEAAAGDHPSCLSPVSIEKGTEASSHDGQHYMETEGVEETSLNDHQTSMSHIKLEDEEASSSDAQYYLKQVETEKGEKVSTSVKQVCLGLVKTEECEDVLATDGHDLKSQVEIKDSAKRSSTFWQNFLDRVIIEEGTEVTVSDNIHHSVDHALTEGGAKESTIDQQDYLRHVKIEEDAYALDHPPCMSQVKIKDEEQACAIDHLACMSQVKIKDEEEARAIGQQPCMRQVKIEQHEKSGSNYKDSMDHGIIKDDEEAPFAYIIQDLTDQVKSEDREHDKRGDPLPGVIHHLMPRSLASEEHDALGHLEQQYMVYVETEEGREQLVSDNPTFQIGDAMSVSDYYDFTIQKHILSLSDTHDYTTQGDEYLPISEDHEINIQDGEELSDWDHPDLGENVMAESAGNTLRSHYKESDENMMEKMEAHYEDLHMRKKFHNCQRRLESTSQSSTVDMNQQAHAFAFECKEPGKDLSSVCSLTAHNMTPQVENPYLCRDCGQSFCDPSSFLVHQRIHPSPRPYPCPECGKRFTAKSTVSRHLQIHARANSFPCEEHGNRFIPEANDKLLGEQEKQQLMQQGWVTDSQREQPVLAEYRPPQLTGCTVHVILNSAHSTVSQEINTKQRPYVYLKCEKSSAGCLRLVSPQRSQPGKQLVRWIEHMGRFGQQVIVSVDQELHKRKTLRKRKKCRKSTSLLSTLNINQQVHVGGLSFTCKECGKDVNSVNSLIEHNMTHVENPYLCHDCGQSFFDPSSFLVHQRIHPTPRPYPCPECGKCFTAKSTVTRHLQIHTRADPYTCD